MAENERIRYIAYPDNANVKSGASEVCVSRNGIVARGLSRSAEVLGELNAQKTGDKQLPDDLLENVRIMQEKFAEAFSWDSTRAEELLERVLGAEGEPSEDLQKGLMELFLASRGSSLNEAGRELITLFTRGGQTAGEIQAYLKEKNPQRQVDELHASRRLVTVLTQLSTSYEA